MSACYRAFMNAQRGEGHSFRLVFEKRDFLYFRSEYCFMNGTELHSAEAAIAYEDYTLRRE
jgi:hypothetical protein